jgi:hypothetical protein
MKLHRKIKLEIVVVTCLLAGLTSNSLARLNPRQASLRGVKEMNVDVVCSKEVKETSLNQEDIRRSILKQLGQTSVKILPEQLWAAAPGRCRLKVLIKVYKPADIETFIYNLKVYFVQTVTLQRIPEIKVDAVTWELSWLTHTSGKRLAKELRANLKIMTDNFIRDYQLANPKGADLPVNLNDNTVLEQIPEEQSRSDIIAAYKYVSSKNSKVFHTPRCRSVKRINPENLVGYNSREEAIQAGKRPCKVCRP